MLRPRDFEVADAIGAATVLVGGDAEAQARAVAAGADAATVEVIEVEEVPLAYLSEPAVRARVRAAGPLPG